MSTFRTLFSAMLAVPAFCLAVPWAAPGAVAQEDSLAVPAECTDVSAPVISNVSAPGSSAVSAPARSAAAFPVPEVRTSSRGVLKTTLHACIGKNKIVDQPSGETRVIHTTTYEGTIPGPTLVVKPGDRLSIDLTNNLPANPTNQRGGFFPHDPSTTNFHTHGLTVSPLGNSDNPFRLMEPGTTSPIRVDIPADQPTGTYWYHPHKHGATTYQMIGGMAGFLIVKGGPGTLDAVPEVAAAKDVPMMFQVIRTAVDGGQPFVHEVAEQFGTFPFFTNVKTSQGIWSTYGLDGAPGRSFFYFATNGVTNPTLHMRPGEVQRWRLLNAATDENIVLALQGHGFNIIAMDGITVRNMIRLRQDAAIVLAPGQRMDVLVKAANPGTYQLLDLDPVANPLSVSPSGIDPEPRVTRHSFDFPAPCGLVPASAGHRHMAPLKPEEDPCAATPPKTLAYPISLATVVIDGDQVNMRLPDGPLPVPKGLPSVAKMLGTTPDAQRQVAFEICAKEEATLLQFPRFRLPSCGWFFEKYDAAYWGGRPLPNLLMLRDADDVGKPNDNKKMPRVDFKKDGLFNPDQPLFDDMIAGHYEEWTVVNRSFSDHPFHIHQNPFLVTHINGIPLDKPEWHDTILVPGGQPQPPGPLPLPEPKPNLNKNVDIGSITFRIYFNPITVGCFVMHCHALTHEDIGMMQRLDILPAAGQPSGCKPETMDH
jgi:FtsP/CotA-like multicopper oxidase with cupredoxin domain